MVSFIERAEHYNRSDLALQYPASRFTFVEEAGRPVAYARWVLGADYRSRSGYYGSYPPGLLARVEILFGDLTGPRTRLHAFSGSLPAGPYTRCDCNPDLGAELVCDVLDLPRLTPPTWRLIVADPPYSGAHAKRYGTRMIHRGKVTRAFAAVTVRGGFLAWLDTAWPMHAREQWATVGRIAITRSTNHCLRDLTIFQRRVS